MPPRVVTFAQLRAWYAAAPNFVARQKKSVSQLRYAWPHKTVSFVFGCQRSGTKMVMRILDNSPAIHIFHENHANAFSDFQLRADPVIAALAALHPAPCQIFKPICDSQRADVILDRFPQARGLWVYRAPNDVANSAAEKWGEHQAELVNAVVAGDLGTYGWRTANLPPVVVQALKRVWRPDLTPGEGALLFWFMRNSFYFALGLDQHPRMRLLRYEDVVTAPAAHFPAVFAHVGAPFDPAFIGRVRASSVGLKAPPVASPEILALCAELCSRLDAVAPSPRAVLPPIGSPPRSVLMLINTLGVGGAEKHVLTLANWMAEHGTDVTVAAAPGDLAERFLPSVRYVPMDLVRVRAGLGGAAAAVRRLVAEHRPEVIIANSLAVTLVARAASPRSRVVNIAHGWPHAQYSKVAPLMRAADRVIAVSDDVRAKLVAGGLPPHRCVVVQNGVDLRPFSVARDLTLRRALGAPDGALLVVTAGRLTEQKAQHHVIALATRLPQVHFVIVGTGERADALNALIIAAGVQDRVRLTGVRADVPEIFAAADIYLSCSNWEGMPLTTIEAMAAGLPVVATRTEGADQLLTPACAIVVPVGDVAAMAQAIGDLADPAQRRLLGDAGRARAHAFYSHERMAAEICAAL